jgi:4-alpha-glucanotransferase
MLAGLSVGAPPDDLNALGQNWGLTAFSPRALRLHGYAPFIELLRASLRSVGGLRIDHVLGLRRLWLVPDGAREGAYLLFPFEDMLRLVALESWRHHALIIGEDLGTLPEGFRERLEASGILGLRVLWFQRDHGLFIDPSRWTPHALATTTTHDLPTAAGWWRGRDLDWRARLNLFAPEHPEAGERAQRDQDRRTLWAAYQHNGVAQGPPPPPEQPQAAVDAAVQFVARTAAPLAIVPAEDLLGLDESPNLPGTTDEHPNWRRRLPPGAAAQLQTPEAQRRMDLLRRERG